MINERKLSNLSDYPTEHEIQIQVHIEINKKKQEGLIIDDNGKLIASVWLLSKVTPLDNNKNIYI